MTRKEIAKDLFMQGYNCAQAVAGAFADYFPFPKEVVLKTVSAFGGGLGRMREVCGTVSGMSFVLSTVFGYDTASDGQAKKNLYELVRKGADMFKEKNRSIICRELLGSPEIGGTPSERTPEFYKKRPCVELVGDAVEICEQLLMENKK